MRILLLSFCFFVSFSPSTAQRSVTDLEKMKLTGAVKKIYENQFGIIEDSGLLKKGSLVAIVEASFSPEGYLTSEIINNKAWEPVLSILYVYDEKHRLVKKEMVGSLINGYSYTTYKYDPVKKEVRETEYAGNELNSKTISRYDEDGKMLHQALTLYNQERQSKELNYKYDTNNNLVEAISISKDDPVIKETYEYDDNGLLKIKNLYSGQELVVSIEYRYVLDKLLNWTKQFEIPSVANWDQSFFRERNITYY